MIDRSGNLHLTTRERLLRKLISEAPVAAAAHAHARSRPHTMHLPSPPTSPHQSLLRLLASLTSSPPSPPHLPRLLTSFASAPAPQLQRARDPHDLQELRRHRLCRQHRKACLCHRRRLPRPRQGATLRGAARRHPGNRRGDALLDGRLAAGARRSQAQACAKSQGEAVLRP